MNEEETFQHRPEIVGQKPICIHVDAPSEDCYCFNMNSPKIREAIYYCGGNFDECEIFRKRKSRNYEN